MRSSIPYVAVALALAAGTTAANAQTTITRETISQPVETVVTQQPVVRTTETVRTVRPITRTVVRRRVVTTRRTIVSQRGVAVAPRAANESVAAYPQTLYDVVAPAPAPTVPPPTIDQTVVDQSVGAAIPTYRYVYEPDRILVIDPVTNIAIQSIPR